MSSVVLPATKKSKSRSKKPKVVVEAEDESSSSQQQQQEVVPSPPKVKKAIVKKRPAIRMTPEKQRYLSACAELERIEKKADKLHAEGHSCIRIYEVHPPVLYWCKQKQCVMLSPSKTPPPS